MSAMAIPVYVREGKRLRLTDLISPHQRQRVPKSSTPKKMRVSDQAGPQVPDDVWKQMTAHSRRRGTG